MESMKIVDVELQGIHIKDNDTYRLEVRILLSDGQEFDLYLTCGVDKDELIEEIRKQFREM